MNIFRAADEGDLERVRALIELEGTVVHALDSIWAQRTAMHHAARRGHVEVVRYLCDHGADVNHRDRDGWTPLHLACRRGQTDVVQFLLQCAVDVTAVTRTGTTVLSAAAMKGRDGVVRVLLEHGGCALDGINHAGRTAMHHACVKGHSRVVRQLLHAGADPTVRDGGGDTALDLADTEGCEHCVMLLQGWERGYRLSMARGVNEAAAASSSSHAAPALASASHGD